MKNIFKALLLICILTTSCKKDNKNTGTSAKKLYNISFAVNGFSQTHYNLAVLHNSTFAAAVTDTVITQMIFYTVYDINGKLVNHVTETQGDMNYGTFTDQLPAGTYTVIFASGSQVSGTNVNTVYDFGANISEKNISTLGTAYLYGTIQYAGQATPIAYFYDTYLKKITLTVGTSDINQAVALDRIPGLLEVNIEDAIPANAASFTLSYSSAEKIFLTSGYTPSFGTSVIKQVIPDSLKGTINYKLITWDNCTSETSPVIITCLDENNNIIASKTVPNVNIVANTVTILTGNLFGGTGGNSIGGTFTAKADSSWNPVPILKSF